MRGSFVAGACAVFVCLSCGSSGSSSSPSGSGGTVTYPPASPQGKGTPNGAPVTAVVGAAGGVLATPDGVLTVTVPAGALASDVTLSATPITNTAPGGVGPAFRLEPEGQQFTQPVTIAIRPKAAAFDDTSMLVVTQRSDGKWIGNASPTRDYTLNSASVTAKHFSDWAFVSGISIDPPNAAVDPGNSRAFKATICGTEAATDDDGLASLLPTCAQDGGGASLIWAVNGQANGGGNLGTVSANGANATYTAPASNPIDDSVTLSAEATNSDNSKQIAVATIQLGSKGTWTGTVEVEQVTSTGNGTLTVKSVAEVSFRWNEGQMSYKPNGNMTWSSDFIGTEPCEAHATGGKSIVDEEGALNIFPDGSGADKYLGSGALVSPMKTTGTTTCGTTPNGSVQNTMQDVNGYYWWPSAPPTGGGFGFALKNDGKLMEETVTVPGGGGTTGTVKWNLVKQ